jgi:hypothetical protein
MLVTTAPHLLNHCYLHSKAHQIIIIIADLLIWIPHTNPPPQKITHISEMLFGPPIKYSSLARSQLLRKEAMAKKTAWPATKIPMGTSTIARG